MTAPARPVDGQNSQGLIRLAAIGILLFVPCALFGFVAEAWARSQSLVIPEEAVLQPVTGGVARLDDYANDLGDGVCLTLANQPGQFLVAYAPGDRATLQAALAGGRTVTVWLAPDTRPGPCQHREPLAWKVDVAGDTLVAYEAQRVLTQQANDQRASPLFFIETFVRLLLAAPLPVVAILALLVIVVGAIWVLLLVVLGIVWLLLPLLLAVRTLLRWLREGVVWLAHPLGRAAAWLGWMAMTGIVCSVRSSLWFLTQVFHAITALIRHSYRLCEIGVLWCVRFMSPLAAVIGKLVIASVGLIIRIVDALIQHYHRLRVIGVTGFMRLMGSMARLIWLLVIATESLVSSLVGITNRISAVIGRLYGLPLRMISKRFLATRQLLVTDQRRMGLPIPPLTPQEEASK